MGMYGLPQCRCQFYNGISRYLVKTILPNRLPLLFVEIALEEITSDQYGSQWLQRRPLAGAGGNSKLYLQYFVDFYLHAS